MDQPVYVTKPFMPPFWKFSEGLKKIWNSRILTNNGPYHQEFEDKLVQYLDVPFVSLFSNATLALFAALKVLDLDNCEIITTPFSFPATSHVIKLVNSTPVFVDIKKSTCCIDEALIEDAITPLTKAILPVHVYGNACSLSKINLIAKKHNLKIIYDAAHAFGFNDILSSGDLSVLSFHATKLFNTLEGGAIISHDLEMKQKIDRFKNFGIEYEDLIPEIGFNAKMNEFQALFGLLNLENMTTIDDYRLEIVQRYNIHFIGKIELLPSDNNSYYPILVDNRDDLYEILKSKNIYARKYFYPLISNLKPYQSLASANPDNLPLANKIANRVLCLPIYPELKKKEQDRIITTVLESGVKSCRVESRKLRC